jgi:pSer/pThr/pTyr-binding forkhead associated (FHA) protein
MGPPRESDEELQAREDAERLGLPFLVYRDGEETQRIFALEPGRRSATVGRRDEADISLPWDPECSRLHAELELRAGEWTLTDDGLSQNGTWVNELRLAGRRRLADGDVIRVGRTLLTFYRPGVAGIGPTLVPGELSATPRFSEQQQRILRELCRPLFGEGEGLAATPDDAIAASLGTQVETVSTELDHLTRALGLEDLPREAGRSELALLAMRSGLVGADDSG